MHTIPILLLSSITLVSCVDIVPNTWCSGPNLATIIHKCLQEYGGTQADIDDYVYLRPASSPKMKCFRACFFRECQAFNIDGSFVANAHVTAGYLTSRRNPSHWPIVERAAKYCINTIPIGPTICDLTDSFIKCVGENTPKDVSFSGAL